MSTETKQDFNPETQAEEIAKGISDEVIIKYAKGQAEHGGNLFKKPVLKDIREEVVDLISYTHVLNIHKQEILDYIAKMQTDILRGSAELNKTHVYVQLSELRDKVQNL